MGQSKDREITHLLLLCAKDLAWGIKLKHLITSLGIGNQR